MNSWEEFTEKYKKKFETIPMYYAFDEKQLGELKEQLGIQNNEEFKNKVAPFMCGYILKKDIPQLIKFYEQKYAEYKRLLKKDKTGNGFIQDMFYSELINHEYCYTQELDDTLDSLGLTLDEINQDSKLRHGLDLALHKISHELNSLYEDFYEDLER